AITVDADSEIDLQGGGTLPLTYSVAATGRLVLDGQWTLAQAATTLPTSVGTVTLSGDYLFNGGQTLHIDHAVTLDRATFEA
ncbi:hypothetical protein ACI4CV_27925, partial [Klebsiella pneumoniae]|uniref:hypothetical protein n=1 Tax=Klebsiella pneumoniae TaxID=573 RepID=UPI0038545456